MSDQVQMTISQYIVVDTEIADEVYWLNERGVRTEASCSGHGEEEPKALIKPSSVELAEELGYKPIEYFLANGNPSGYFEIQLRGTTSDYLLHEVSKQPYIGMIISSGLCEGHKFDSVYLKLKREGEAPLTLFLRRDEALTIIRLLADALWSEQIALHTTHFPKNIKGEE